MCGNCVSTAEALAVQVGFIGFVVRDPVHRLLARAGFVPQLDVVGRDRTTVDFLRSLDLDPVALLGADAVADADAWVPAPKAAQRARNRSWALPIGSQSLISAQ